MKIGKGKFIICLTAAFLTGALLSNGILGSVLGYVKIPKEDYAAMKDLHDKYDVLDQIDRSIESSFYQETDRQMLLEGACKGYVDALGDPYSSYMTAEEYESWKASMTGEYSGIGVTFSVDDKGNFVIISVNQDSPAERAGLKAGDLIISADGKTYDDIELLANAIKGEEGTEVTVRYSRDGKESDVTLKREEIIQHSVSHEMINEDTAYISITSFIESTSADFEDALDAVEAEGAENLVLDLRDNGGGLVNSCIEVADAFLDKGPVVCIEDKDKNEQTMDAKDGKTSINTVVLVNKNSASAAEILAAALKDNGFPIVGETTFGKGVIQSTSELSNGSALKLTVMQYFSPKGTAIHENGITPDVEIEDAEDTAKDEQLEKALDTL